MARGRSPGRGDYHANEGADILVNQTRIAVALKVQMEARMTELMTTRTKHERKHERRLRKDGQEAGPPVATAKTPLPCRRTAGEKWEGAESKGRRK